MSRPVLAPRPRQPGPQVMHDVRRILESNQRPIVCTRRILLGVFAGFLFMVFDVSCDRPERVTIVEVVPQKKAATYDADDPDVSRFYEAVANFSTANDFEFTRSILRRPANLDPCRKRELYCHSDGRTISVECWNSSLRAFVYSRTADPFGFLRRSKDRRLIEALVNQLDDPFPGRVHARLAGRDEGL